MKSQKEAWGINPNTITAVILLATLIFTVFIYTEQNKGDLHYIITSRGCPDSINGKSVVDLSQDISNTGGGGVTASIYSIAQNFETNKITYFIPGNSIAHFAINGSLNKSWVATPGQIEFTLIVECNNCKTNQAQLLNCSYIRNETVEQQYSHPLDYAPPYYQRVREN